MAGNVVSNVKKYYGGQVPVPGQGDSDGKVKVLVEKTASIEIGGVQTEVDLLYDADDLTTPVTPQKLGQWTDENYLIVFKTKDADGKVRGFILYALETTSTSTDTLVNRVAFVAISHLDMDPGASAYEFTMVEDSSTLSRYLQDENGELTVKFNLASVEAGAQSGPLSELIGTDSPYMQFEVVRDGDNAYLELNTEWMDEEFEGILERLGTIEGILNELPSDEHGYFNSSLVTTPGDGTTTSIIIDNFRISEGRSVHGDNIEFVPTHQEGGVDFGEVYLNPGTYILNVHYTLQWVGNPRGTFHPIVTNVGEQPFDFSYEHEDILRSTRIVTRTTRGKFGLNLPFDADTPPMGIWVKYLEIAQIASYNHPAVTHDTTLAGSGQIGDPLGVTPAAFGKVKDIPTSISQFRNGDVIPVDGPNGPAKMPNSALRDAILGGPIDEAVQAWLNEHPEATTTVEDNSITDTKLHPSIKFNRSQQLNGNMGYKLLSQDSDFASQLTEENTIYEIRWAFDLLNSEVTIPQGSVLFFNGGKLVNGTLLGAFTIQDTFSCIFGNITLKKGDCSVTTDYLRPEWFGALGDYSFTTGTGSDDSSAINTCIVNANNIGIEKILFTNKVYYIDSGIVITNGNIILQGCGALAREELNFVQNNNFEKNLKSTLVKGTSGAIVSVSGMATHPVQVFDLNFRSVGTADYALKFSSEFSGPQWPVNIFRCYFRDFRKAIFVSNPTLQYNIHKVCIKYNAFHHNDWCVYFDDFSGTDPHKLGCNITWGFEFSENNAHQNTCVVRVGVSTGICRIYNNNIEGSSATYKDGSSAANDYSIDVAASYSAEVVIVGNHMEAMTHPVIMIRGCLYVYIDVHNNHHLGSDPQWRPVSIKSLGYGGYETFITINKCDPSILYECTVNFIYNHLILNSYVPVVLKDVANNAVQIDTNCDMYIGNSNVTSAVAEMNQGIPQFNFAVDDNGEILSHTVSGQSYTSYVPVGPSASSKWLLTFKSTGGGFKRKQDINIYIPNLINSRYGGLYDNRYKIHITAMLLESAAVNLLIYGNLGFYFSTFSVAWSTDLTLSVVEMAKHPSGYKDIVTDKRLSMENPYRGMSVYDRTLKKLVVYDGTKWINTDGTDADQ